MKGKLIVFEGVEGCGKTTQIQLCGEWLQSLGIPVVITREPGGTELGLHLRRLLLQKAEGESSEPSAFPITDRAELLLYAADRSQHVEELKPILADGKIILCDRYTDSTVAYQGYGRGLDMNLIVQLNTIATNGLESDLTIWLDVDAEVGLARKRQASAIADGDGAAAIPVAPARGDRIEQENIAFHRRVQKGYTELAASYQERIVRVDASVSVNAMQQAIQKILLLKLDGWGYKQVKS
ncbi:dTMP kinase [Chlorogloeopsis fritschii PCC 9212]|uniref:Thymidylate kinase n=1 Tax=Chlorogloeopsis fritschii PCC 6912 TaxID=211165 RepID=A0A3S0XP46_CHLFR|nr:dTMP kinase [Chlorogloeopsis fritschii]MBF2009235.1 dTMP kinase [Chlorogloeopsis fritschii C42_A2020_084]RUR77128.1 thymidylate kinase [Chlorogloeopsis fritschii PCC 6912]